MNLNSKLKFINLITFFSKNFSYLNNSVLGKTIKENNIKLKKIDIVKYCKSIKDRPDDKLFGGGKGMILKPDIAEACINKVSKKKLGILLIPSPEGEMVSASFCNSLLNYEALTILCPRYEGFDERIAQFYKAKKFSIGKYIVSDGDVAAMVLLSATLRRIRLPQEVLENESFENSKVDNIECAHYTRPRVWKNISVPQVLLDGNHKEIELWRKSNFRKNEQE